MQLAAHSALALQAVLHIPIHSHSDLVQIQRLVQCTLASDPYHLHVQAGTLYVIRTAVREVAVVRQGTSGQQVICFVAPNKVSLFRLPDVAVASAHLTHELSLSVTLSVSAGSAMFEGLSRFAIQLLERGQIVLRIAPSDKCHIISQYNGTPLSAAVGLPWAFVLALILKGYGPADFQPTHLPHILAVHSVQTKGVIRGSDVSADPVFGNALQQYFASFQQEDDSCTVQHRITVVQADLANIPAIATDTECIGACLCSCTKVDGSAFGNIGVPCHPSRVALARAVTFVRNTEEKLTEVWIEQVH